MCLSKARCHPWRHYFLKMNHAVSDVCDLQQNQPAYLLTYILYYSAVWHEAAQFYVC